MASSAAIVIAALVVVLFKFKSIVASVVVVAFVVAFDEPMKPFWYFRSDSSSFLLLDNRITFFVTRDGGFTSKLDAVRCFFFNGVRADGGASSTRCVVPLLIRSDPFFRYSC